MITIIGPIPKFKRDNVDYICECGNTRRVQMKYYESHKNMKCGHCALFRFQNNMKDKYGSLSPMFDPTMVLSLKDSKNWKCDCGKIKSICINSVVKGLTKSCGCFRPGKRYVTHIIHENLSKLVWLEKIPELIDKNLPGSWSLHSSAKFEFICKCGHIFNRMFRKYKIGISRCGNCFDLRIKNGDKVGYFLYRGNNQIINTSSYLKDKFQCVCGTISDFSIKHVFSGQQKCTYCNRKSIEWWNSQKFGRLKIFDVKDVQNLSVNSESKVKWLCDCGSTYFIRVSFVTSGETQNCQNCRSVIFNWWLQNKQKLKELKTPILPKHIPFGGPKLQEIIISKSNPAHFLCWICNREYKTRLFDIILGKSLSCGCISGKITKPNLEIDEFVKKLGFHTELEYGIGRFHFDCAIPEKKILIEYQGSMWHSSEKVKQRDQNKQKLAIDLGWKLLVIYEKDWLADKESSKSTIELELNNFKEI